MQTTTSLKQDKSNIDPQRMHRQQRFWQIIFPVSIVGVALVGGMVYLLLTAGIASEDVAGLAQTATVILTLPLLLMLLPILVITIALIILLGKLAGWLPKAGEMFLSLAKMCAVLFERVHQLLLPPFSLSTRKTPSSNS